MWKQIIRRFFGVHTPKQAEKVKLGLAIVYAFISWHVLSYVFLHQVKAASNTVEERIEKLAKLSEAKNVMVVRIGGKKANLEDDASKITGVEYFDLDKKL